MKTFQDRLTAGLLALGWVEDPNDRSKYKAFRHSKSPNKLFVGRSGALRCGECASRSLSIGDPTNMGKTYTAILKAGDKELAKGKVLKEYTF